MRQIESALGAPPKSWRSSVGRHTRPPGGARPRGKTLLACLKHPTLNSRRFRCALLISQESLTAPSCGDRVQRETMTQRTKGRSEGVQIRLDPDLKHEARLYLTMANMTWQDLLEPCVRKFVEESRAQMPRQRLETSRERT